MESKFLTFVKLETTGLPDYTSPSGSINQPHIVYLSAILVDSETRETVAFVNSIVKPEGWVIPQETIDIHGITNEMALEAGRSEFSIINELNLLIAENPVVCHSAFFVGKVLRTAAKRYLGDDIADQWKERGYIDTAKLTKDLIKIPAAKPNTYKLPTIDQAYEVMTRKKFADSKVVGGSANAVKDIYFAYQDLLGNRFN